MSRGARHRRAAAGEAAAEGSSALVGLVAAYEAQVGVLRHHRTGQVGLPAEQVAERSLAALAVSRRLAEAALAQRWVLVGDALGAGATVGEVAEACGLTTPEVGVGLRLWIAGRRHAGCLSPAVAGRLEALLTRATATVAGLGAQRRRSDGAHRDGSGGSS